MTGGLDKLGSEIKRSTGGRTTRTAEVAIDRTLGSRYELKYVIPPATAKAVEHFVGQYLPKDRYSKLQPDGFYPIVSLYIDSPDLQLCRESINGKLNRFKLRIRSYTDDPAYPRFFEIKRRANTVIVKSRYRAKEKDVAPLLAGKYIHSQYYGTDEKILRQFQLYVRSIGAGPAILIKYLRKAYEGEGHNRVRVTFDKDLMYNVTEEPTVRLNCKGYQLHKLSLDKVILEIKFTGRYPEWLSKMAKHFQLQQQSMSKYASSVRESCVLRFCAPRLSTGF